MFAVAFSPNSRWLATGNRDTGARIWVVHSGQQQRTFSHDSGVAAVAFSPDGRWLATGSGYQARIWDAHSGQQLHTLSHNDSLWAMASSPNGRWLATGTGGNRAVLWMLTPPSHQ